MLSGQILYITGSNGVGKTTLLRTIIGLHKQYHGEIAFHFKHKLRAPNFYCHYFNNKSNMKDCLTIKENLALWGDCKAQNSNINHKLFGELSRGQQQKIALQRLLITKRPLWLLDEPFIHLDKINRLFLTDLLTEHSNNGGIALIASHTTSPEPYIDLDYFL